MTAKKKIPLHIKMALGFGIGLTLGLIAHFAFAETRTLQFVIDYFTQPVGQIFLRLLFMLVIPLVFSALVMGIVEMGDIRSLGRIGWKTLLYTVVVSSIAVIIGLVLTNLLQPGGGVDPELAQNLLSDASGRAQSIISDVEEKGAGISMLSRLSPIMCFARLPRTTSLP